MGSVKQGIVVLLSAGLLSCGNSSSKGTNATGKDQPSSSPSAANASFSATIDGTTVSGNEIDDLQVQNTAFIYPPLGKNPQKVLFFLYTNKNGSDYYSFRFSFPDKEGTYKFTNETDESCSCSLMLDYNIKSEEYFPRYDQDSVTVTIDKISSTRITGTFAGILRLSDDTRSKPYKKNVTVTDGKFDIPFSTGNIRPE